MAITFRVFIIIFTTFPINDGALFLEFTKKSAETFPLIPFQVTYNGMDLPFAYPPLSFWVAGGLVDLGFDALQLVRVLPILLNIGYVALFVVIVRRENRSLVFQAIAILFFVTIFRSFEWLLMGGGLSRGLGSVFFMLALLATGTDRSSCLRPSLSRLLFIALFTAGAILSHLEWGLLTAASVTLSRLLKRDALPRAIIELFIIGMIALALISPWLAFVIQKHGIEPFRHASQSSEWSDILYVLVMALIWPMIGNFLVLIGLVSFVRRRALFWPCFAVICIVLTPRHAATAIVPALAICAAQGAASLYSLLCSGFKSAKLPSLTVASVIFIFALSSVAYAVTRGSSSFRILPVEARQAMHWVSIHHPGTHFAIINRYPWAIDSSAEWFPTLSSAISVTTVQGREWTDDFLLAVDRSDRLKKGLVAGDRAGRLENGPSCDRLLKNLRPYGKIDFIWSEGYDTCFQSHHYKKVYGNRKISIFAVEAA